MKIINIKQDNIVTPAQMKAGQFGVIRLWKNNEIPVGSIVYKFDIEYLVSLSKGGDGWRVRAYEVNDINEYAIEILPPGTQFEI